MKNRNTLLFAGALGLLTLASYLLLKRLSDQEKYSLYYNDFHNLFGSPEEDDSHGIEYYSMR